MDPVSPIEQTQAPIQAPNKKYVLLAFGVIAVIVLFVIITVITMTTAKKPVSPQTSTQPNKGKSDNPKQNSLPSVSPGVVDNWKTYQNAEYSINYPQDWQVEELRFPNGDTGTSFRPAVKVLNNPSMLVINMKTASLSAIKEEQYYLSMGFGKSNILIDNQSALQLKGTIPQVTSATVGKSVIHVQHIYLKQAEGEYLLKYTYVGSAIDPILESTFNKMIVLFQFVHSAAT